jgi:hypothetical protein
VVDALATVRMRYTAVAVIVLGFPAATAEAEQIVLNTSGSDGVTSPAVLSGGGDESAVVWVQARPRRVFVALADAAGHLGRRQRLGRPTEHAAQPRAALSPSGRTLVAWTRRHRHRLLIRVAERRPAGRGFTAPVTLSTGRRNDDARVAMNAQGAAVVAWVRQTGGRCGRSFIDISSRGGADRPFVRSGSFVATRLASGYCTAPPEVAIDGQGRFTVVWTQLGTPNNFSGILAATGPAGRRLAAAVQVSPHGPIAESPRVATDAAGATTIAWRYSYEIHAIGVVQRPAGTDAFGPVTDLDPGADGNELALVTNPAGTTLLAWVRPTNDGGRKLKSIVAATHPPGGQFGQPQILDGPFFNTVALTTAVSPDGHAAVGWNGYRNDTTDWRPFVSLAAPAKPFGVVAGLASARSLTGLALKDRSLLLTSLEYRRPQPGVPEPVVRPRITVSTLPLPPTQR